MAVCDSMPLQRLVPVPLVAVVAPHGPQFAAQAVGHAVGVEGRAGGVVVDGVGRAICGFQETTHWPCDSRASTSVSNAIS